MFNKKPVWVVLPNAGVGKRVGSTIPKQYLEINGKMIIEWTLELFSNLNFIDGIVVANNKDDGYWESVTYNGDTQLHVVEGGDERIHSVLAGCNRVQVTAPDNAWVLVHDVARPLVSEEAIFRLVSLCIQDNVAGILANQVSDTIKVVIDGKIKETIDRELLWQAQTPQMFPVKKLIKAIEFALGKGLVLTDESSAFESSGFSVNVVESPKSNIKVTFPEDLDFVEFIKSSVNK